MIVGADGKIRENQKIIDELTRMHAEIQRIIVQRKEQAREKGIHAMAVRVVKEFGRQNPKSHGSNWVYESGMFTLVWDDYGDNLSIVVGDKTVFKVHMSNTILYCPGDWEQKLEQKYKVAMIKHQERTIARMKQEIAALRAKWGIRDEELEKDKTDE